MPAVLFRTVLIYAAAVATMRLMGKRQLGELQPSELVSTILISNLASISIEAPETSLAASMVPLLLIAAMEVMLSAGAARWQGLRRLLGGRPIIVIRDGVIDQRALKELRFSPEDLLSTLRGCGYFTPADVALAMVETGGKLTVLPKAEKAPLTNEAAEKKPAPALAPAAVVVDGHVDTQALAACEKDVPWLSGVLRSMGLSYGQVYLMLCTKAGVSFCAKKDAPTKRRAHK